MPLKVLVVDDSFMIRTQVGRALRAAGYEVSEAADGLSALAHLAGSPDTRLVICDVNMPAMSGLELLVALSAMKGAKTNGRGGSTEPPDVLMLTTEGQPALMRRARELGAKGWITKPFDASLLVAAADKMTRTERVA